MTEDKILLTCAHNWEETLCHEIASYFPDLKPFSPARGLVICNSNRVIKEAELIFCQHKIFEVTEIQEESVKTLVEKIGEIVDPILDETPLPWRIDIKTPGFFVVEDETYLTIRSRGNLIEEKFLERMKKFRKRAYERFKPWPDSLKQAACFVFIQGLLSKSNTLFLGISRGKKLGSGKFHPQKWLSPHEMIPIDDLAPCRSYYKLEEAFRLSATGPHKGQTCVDLGAAPGGWSWAALKRGAKVIAIDAADMVEHVETHPNLEHLKENGYSFKTSSAVDWLFCDMIVKPMGTLGLLERWLQENLTKGFVFNIKFRGKDPKSIISSIQQLKQKFNLSKLIVKHLVFDKNEITLISPPA
ncbi:MAG: hypothetical protein HQM08_13130 [Candidatus Riflebacteria bacterium]|nr:hypothetical protein [Candidatus Riflebacteria bacterium]